MQKKNQFLLAHMLGGIVVGPPIFGICILLLTLARFMVESHVFEWVYLLFNVSPGLLLDVFVYGLQPTCFFGALIGAVAGIVIALASRS